ncbi:hypothetical protein ASPWEDRAFT_344534 [Aspergillus wentii DTO 134E9]|uniref:C2H2-type domain-containing protein n=1 Tax=Aspergillus wentii DTO 134E9 TaxID=1073089 RepID=A0A1L9RVC6_ASPWE|nr:uncharacterized protein ASPWEDRAFT_344534 [Aspergillus wentii DTO 134E9]KAI9928774.1 hypothetical protein MW887_001992 [Aspergillus wentii]OJJ38872.1 hypothetical protein ASPWEDRAFT_344534 [Aspergillus wentii DTO 134E9]
MACKASFVSILNNDDNPSFTVRSAPRLSRHHSSPSYPYYPDQQQSLMPDYRSSNYPESTASSPRMMRYPFDPVSEAAQPVSPGSSDCSHDYMTSGSTSSYFQFSRQDSYAYSSSITPAEKRLSGASSAEPPSPQNSIGGSKDMAASKSIRKNKYPCPYAASHNCSATFTTSGHAARHGKKHTGEKSVHCPICNKAFTRKDNMKQHIRTHRTHSEDMPTGMPERNRDGEASRWRTTTTTRDASGHNHSRSISNQSQLDGNTYHNVAGMPTRTPSGSHRRTPF